MSATTIFLNLFHETIMAYAHLLCVPHPIALSIYQPFRSGSIYQPFVSSAKRSTAPLEILQKATAFEDGQGAAGG